MQTFKDSVTGKIWQFEDDVKVAQKGGVYSFATADGVPLTNVSQNLQPYSIPAPTTAELLAEAQQEQIASLSNSAAAAYVAGFSSSALGSAHTYSSQITDQIKLSGAVTASQSPSLPANWTVLFWCADSNGKWTHAAHTATEIQQVLADALTVAEGISSKLGTLTDQVNAATTVSDVQAITW